MIRRSVTIVEAGEILGMTRSAAYRAAKAGEIHTISIGSRYLVPVAWLEDLLGEALDLEQGHGRSTKRSAMVDHAETGAGSVAHG